MEILQGSSAFPHLIPQVQSQLVMSLPDATNIDDVAGFPSRISIRNNQTHTFTGPEFGASKHLAAILLQVQQYNPEKQAAIVIKYLEGMEKEFNQYNLAFIAVTRKETETNADTDSALFSAISEALASGNPFDVIVDKGFFGIEPVVYIFAKNAKIAAEKAHALSKALVLA
jgi:predicted fused transcriptional regulator/phosphomethylpyrimidine kinase